MSNIELLENWRTVRNLHLVFVLLHVVLLAIPGRVGAQIDTEFWFVAPEVTSSHGDDPVLLRSLSARGPCSGCGCAFKKKTTLPSHLSFLIRTFDSWQM